MQEKIFDFLLNLAENHKYLYIASVIFTLMIVLCVSLVVVIMTLVLSFTISGWISLSYFIIIPFGVAGVSWICDCFNG